jgi:DNA-binding IclR family transcriptional regulator
VSEISQTADRGLQTLLELAAHDGLTVVELAERLGSSRGVAQRLGATLRARSMVIQDDDGRYFLGPGLIALAEKVPHVLASVSEPELAELSHALGETVVVSVRHGDDARVVASRPGGSGPLRVEYAPGYSHPLATGASGLAILAHEDPLTRERLLSDGEKQLAAIREQGYVLSEGQLRQQMAGLSCPIFTSQGTLVGSIAVIVPASRASALQDMRTALLDAAQRIGQHAELCELSPDELAAALGSEGTLA